MFQILFLFFLNFFKIDKLITDVDLFEVNKFFFNYYSSCYIGSKCANNAYSLSRRHFLLMS